MKKGLLMSLALVASVATLTGCGKSTKTLSCVQVSESGGFRNVATESFKFEDNRVKTATSQKGIAFEAEQEQYFDEYKKNAEKTAEEYNKISGFSAKVETSGTNMIMLTVDMDASKLSDSDISAYNLNESYESMTARLTDRGYTCN